MESPTDFQPLIDEIFREKVRRARAEKQPGVLSLAGFDLFEDALDWIRAGVRADLSGATEEEIEAEVQRRIEIRRRLDEDRIYRPVP